MVSTLSLNPYYGKATKDTLLRVILAQRKALWEMAAASSVSYKEANVARDKALRIETQMELLQTKFGRLTDIVTDIRELSERVDTVTAEAPLINWHKRLEEYLEESKYEQKKDNTWRTKKKILTPWVDWIWRNGNRPTSQKIKQYMTLKRKRVESYRGMGTAIVNFTNHWAETWNKVELVKALGQLPEKDTLTMSQEALESL